jgi:hypothetical protein
MLNDLWMIDLENGRGWSRSKVSSLRLSFKPTHISRLEKRKRVHTFVPLLLLRFLEAYAHANDQTVSLLLDGMVVLCTEGEFQRM